MPCSYCGRGLHFLCNNCGTCHPEASEATPPVAVSEKDYVKLDKEYKDRKSTGRKRAAHLYPLNREEPCEWQMQKNCGGGKYPIYGCVIGLQEHRHHGPIKDTLHNEVGNVHRICTNCHNHWHELNDTVYIEAAFTEMSHSPQPAEMKELIAKAAEWKNGQVAKKYVLASSVKKLDLED